MRAARNDWLETLTRAVALNNWLTAIELKNSCISGVCVCVFSLLFCCCCCCFFSALSFLFFVFFFFFFFFFFFLAFFLLFLAFFLLFFFLAFFSAFFFSFLLPPPLFFSSLFFFFLTFWPNRGNPLSRSTATAHCSFCGPPRRGNCYWHRRPLWRLRLTQLSKTANFHVGHRLEEKPIEKIKENLTQISFDVMFIIIYSLPSLLVLLESQFQVAVTYCYFRSPDTVTSRILVLVEVEVCEAKVRGTEDNCRMSHAAVLRSLSQQLLRNNKVGALSFMFFLIILAYLLF